MIGEPSCICRHGGKSGESFGPKTLPDTKKAPAAGHVDWGLPRAQRASDPKSPVDHVVEEKHWSRLPTTNQPCARTETATAVAIRSNTSRRLPVHIHGSTRPHRCPRAKNPAARTTQPEEQKIHGEVHDARIRIHYTKLAAPTSSLSKPIGRGAAGWTARPTHLLLSTHRPRGPRVPPPSHRRWSGNRRREDPRLRRRRTRKTRSPPFARLVYHTVLLPTHN